MHNTSIPERPTALQILSAIRQPAVIVGALGYFVDIYDIVLFLVVRQTSLKSLNFTGDALVSQGTWLISCQMIGMLIGGVAGGLIGDRYGRRSLLFGSIIVYSLANIANAFAYDINTYSLFRFLAGLGLAGELGGCITLVSELLPRNVRGYGTCLLSAIGVLGAVVAGEVAQYFDWRTAYIIGGVLGLLLLILRVGVSESKMFEKHNSVNPPTFAGQLAFIFLSRTRLFRYISCILIGLPCWYVIGLLVAYSPEIAKELNTSDIVKTPLAIMFCYAGISLGDVISGIACQLVGSRKTVLMVFMTGALVVSGVLLTLSSPNIYLFYSVVFILGIFAGYWAVFATVAAEHFGTNIRATIATTVPNFCRGSLSPVLALFTYLKPMWGVAHSCMAIGGLISVLALIGWLGLRETFHDDLDYIEE